MQSTITVWAFFTDERQVQRLVGLSAAQGWDLVDMAQAANQSLELTPDICCFDDATRSGLADILRQHPACLTVVFADQPSIEHDVEPHLTCVPGQYSDAELLEILTTNVNLFRFKAQFADSNEAEPTTQLPRHAELMQSIQQHMGKPMGLISAQVDHAQHLYANLDPVSRTDLLGALSNHLQQTLPDNAQMGILDAACFAIWLPESEAAELEPLAETLCQRSQQPVSFRNGQVHFSLSCGYAHAQVLQDTKQLWLDAWHAKEQMQRAGGNGARGNIAPGHVEKSIPEALAQHEFSLLLQPQYSICGSALRGVECLLRWQGLEVGSLAPDHFIPIAERSGQMARVGDWVLERASCESATWLEHLISPITLGINISPQQFHNDAIVEQIERLATDQWLDPTILELEMSHTNLLQVIDHHRNGLFGLRDLGVRIAIDNLGTDLVDTEKMLSCPADTLKVDRSLIGRMLDDEAAERLIGQICELGPRFELRVVAVGIENKMQGQKLAEMGCIDGQGYHFAPPVPLEEFQRYLSTERQDNDNDDDRDQDKHIA